MERGAPQLGYCCLILPKPTENTWKWRAMYGQALHVQQFLGSTILLQIYHIYYLNSQYLLFCMNFYETSLLFPASSLIEMTTEKPRIP